jgi:predicted extracellular nuclease
MTKNKVLKYLGLMVIMVISMLLFNMKTESVKEDDPKAVTVAFYNVENLFDTIDDPRSNDEKFLPQSKSRWNSLKYLTKIKNLGQVIHQLGDSNGPELLGLCEVENNSVLDKLIQSEYLMDRKYKIIQFESKDKRGIDVALLYKPAFFKPINSKVYTVENPSSKNFKTRDILLVSGNVKSDTIHVIVNHWPSRVSGKDNSESNRLLVASKVGLIIDSLYKSFNKAKIIVMGDFNDEPNNKSISQNLKAKPEVKDCQSDDLYNPFYVLMKEGKGTYKYEGDWDMLDQIMISPSLTQNKTIFFKEKSANVYDPLWLYYKQSKQHGPYRTFLGNKYFGGYSDHFPVYIQLKHN